MYLIYRNTNLLIKIFIIYLIIQPVLDIFTTLSLHYIKTGFTFGIIFRVLFMTFALLFIFFNKNSKLYKYLVWYIIILFTILGIGLIYNYYTKPIFNLFIEVQFVTKTLYFPILLCAFLSLFSSKLIKIREINEYFLKAVTVSMSIVALSLFLSILTDTSGNTYKYIKAGYKGWFYAGNELSAIIAITFPIVFLYSSYKTLKDKKTLFWIATFLLSLLGHLIGTKVGYFAILATITIGVIIFIFYWLININRHGMKNSYNTNLIISIILLVSYISLTPFSPSYSNLISDSNRYTESESNNIEDVNKNDLENSNVNDKLNENKLKIEEKNNNKNSLEKQYLLSKINIILSSRNQYFSNFVGYYNNADIIQKIFGMGYAGNYEDQPKLIEMDFFDLFFSFGLLGFLLLMLPFILIGIILIKKLFFNLKQILNLQNILLLISFVLSIGIALLAGHVLYAPAVSIYLSLTTSIIYINLLKNN